MKATTKTTIELTTKELETIRNFIEILDNNKSLNSQATWDIMKSILDEDDEILNEYGYYLDIQ